VDSGEKKEKKTYQGSRMHLRPVPLVSVLLIPVFLVLMADGHVEVVVDAHVAIVVINPGLITAKIMYVVHNIGDMSEGERAGRAIEKGYHDQLSDGHGHWW
jgi:hypothetical protein